MSELFWLAPAGSVLAILFAGYLVRWILKKDEGTDEMVQIAEAVREGASAYLKKQYTTVAIFFLFAFFLLFTLAKYGYLPIFVPFAFLTGGFFSGLSGFIGWKKLYDDNDLSRDDGKYGLTGGIAPAVTFYYEKVSLNLMYVPSIHFKDVDITGFLFAYFSFKIYE